MTTRRAFIAGAVAVMAAPLAAQEKPAREYRIGVLDVMAEPANAANMTQLRKGLKDLGYVEGKNLVIEYRSADARNNRYPALAAELARAKVDLIIANGTPAAFAARTAAGPIPAATPTARDPVEPGLVASLERPGGNVTGLAVITHELEAKRVELLAALAPRRKRIGVFVNMNNPGLAET